MTFGLHTTEVDVTISDSSGNDVVLTVGEAVLVAKSILVRYLPPHGKTVDVELPDERTVEEPPGPDWVRPGEQTVEDVGVLKDFEGEKHIRWVYECRWVSRDGMRNCRKPVGHDGLHDWQETK